MKHFLKTFALLAIASLALAGSKVAPDLKGDNSNIPADVIVRFKNLPSKNELKQLGPYGQIKKVFSHVNAAEVSLTPTQITALLAADSNIVYISPNRTNTGALDITTAAVNADMAWSSGYNGTAVGVAIIDSGIALHDDLKTSNGAGTRVVYSESFLAGLDASDEYGHGTHVAGIVGSNGHDSTGSLFTRTYKGVAPNVNLISLRVLDANGSGTDSGVIAAIDRAIDLKSTYNIRVINLSLGRPVFESYTLDPLCQAVEAAWRSGIVVVTAAGNYGRENAKGTKGYGTIAAPGNDPYVITVGAMNAMGTAPTYDDKIASYSSKGPTAIDHIVKPDIVAPGNSVTSLLASPNSTLAVNFPKTLVDVANYETGVGGKSGTYFQLSGTSMATPAVSGAAALLIQKTPSLTPDQVKARLMKSARKAVPLYSTSIDKFTLVAYGNQSDIFTVGAGYLDIQGALANTDLVTLPAMSPTAVYNPATHKITILRDMTVIWGDTVLWGDTVIWGTTVFNGTLGSATVLWGDTVIWGDSTTSGFTVIWGDTALQASSLSPFELDDSDDNQ